MKNNDISKQKFNKLTVIKRVGQDNDGRTLWICKCDCGNDVIVNTTDLRKGRRKSCGCLKKERYSIIGSRFGKLTVISKKTSGSHASFLCRCDCGKEITVRGDSLRSGRTVSCGCGKKSDAKAKQLESGRALVDHTSPVFFKGTIKKNNKTGINGVSKLKNGKYRASIGYKNKVYSLIENFNINTVKTVRAEAERAVKEGNFEEWIVRLKER